MTHWVCPSKDGFKYALKASCGFVAAPWPPDERQIKAENYLGLRTCIQRLVDLDLQNAVEILRCDRAHHLVGDGAVAADDKSFRHAVDAPFDRGAAVAVDADDAERIAVAAEKAPGVVRRVLVVDADELQPLVLTKRDKERGLVMARHAPRRPDVDDADLALEDGGIEPGNLHAVAGEAIQRRQRGLRRRAANQRRGNPRWVARSQPKPEH